MKLMTKAEFIRYIETNDTGYTSTDFEKIDIDDLIEKLELTESFFKMYMKNYDIAGLIESYETKLAYQNAQLLTKEELFEFIEMHNVDLSAEDFEGIDIDDFIKSYYLTKEPAIKNPASIKSSLDSYKQRFEYRTAKNYNYLFTTEYETLKEEDIPNIVRLYCGAWIGSNDLGALGYWAGYIIDFEENMLSHQSPGFGPEWNSIYIIGKVFDLPSDAFENICELLTKNNIVKMKQTKFPETANAEGTWNLCIELKDGRIIRYSSAGKPPKSFSGFAYDLYKYVLNNLTESMLR